MLSAAVLTLLIQGKPDAILRRLVDRLQTAGSVSGSVVVEQGGVKRRYEFRLARPRSYRVVGKDREYHCDGRRRYEYSPHLGEYLMADLPSYARVAPPFLRGFEGFFDPKNLGYRARSVERSSLGEVMTLEPDDGGAPVKLTLSGDGLPLAWERGEASARYDGVRADAGLVAIAAWKPPTGAVNATPRAGRALEPGETAPDFTVRRLGGGFLRLANEVAGKRAVLVQYWHVDCPPCREALPVVQGLVDRYGKQGFAAIGLNRSDPEEAIDRLLKLQGAKFPIGLRAHDAGIVDRYRIPGSPTFFLIGPDRKVIATLVGYRPGEIEAELAKIGFK